MIWAIVAFDLGPVVIYQCEKLAVGGEGVDWLSNMAVRSWSVKAITDLRRVGMIHTEGPSKGHRALNRCCKEMASRGRTQAKMLVSGSTLKRLVINACGGSLSLALDKVAVGEREQTLDQGRSRNHQDGH